MQRSTTLSRVMAYQGIGVPDRLLIGFDDNE